jgi:hypothetical protein
MGHQEIEDDLRPSITIGRVRNYKINTSRIFWRKDNKDWNSKLK